MKLKLAKIVGSNEPLSKLMTSVVPISTAFRLKEVLKEVQKSLESYDETRKELITKHGKDGEITPKSKDWDKFVTGMNELLETETKLDVEKINQSALSKVEISASDISALDWLIKE
jgi:hypothetical protein|tara:strand:- start:531 stop:878 length:348 start_codon:yes stop_codon:yes gene_type:complete